MLSTDSTSFSPRGSSGPRPVHLISFSQTISASDSVAVLVSTMASHPGDATIQETGCDALYKLVDGFGATQKANRSEAVAAGALEAVVAGMQAHIAAPAVQIAACRTLGALTGNTGADNIRAGAAGAIEAVTLALKTHRKTGRVNQCGCEALIYLMYENESNQARAGAAGTVEAVVTALREFPTNDMVQRYGCYAVAALAKSHPDNKNRALKAGARAAADKAAAAVGSNAFSDLTRNAAREALRSLNA
jgi:hypothetical protein